MELVAAARGVTHGQRGSRRRGPCVLLVGLLLLAVLASAGPALSEELSFARLNRTYTDVVSVLEPVEMGPARVTLRSPQNVVNLISHLARASASPLGGIDVVLVVEFQGSGLIEADVVMTGVDTTIKDALVVPRQSLEIRGRASVAKDETGYVVRAIELQPNVVVRIQSELASRLFRICRPMGLVLVSLDCRELERSLTMVEVALPQDQSFTLEFAELSDEERAAFDRFLDRL